MVIAAFPAAKLSILLVKQISKPIANLCKENAKNHPFFRKYVCMPPAQFYNWCEVKAKMWILNLGRPVNIPVLSQDMAIELGANLLGEAVIFAIGSTLLIFEYNRQAKKEAAKEEKRQNELDHVTSTLRDLYFTVQQQQTQLREMERVVLNLTSLVSVKTSEELKKPQDPPKASPGANTTPPPTEPVAATSLRDRDAVVLMNTPYPDRGFVLQALNYVQMDILNTSLHAEKKTEQPRNYTRRREREQGAVSKALDDIEQDHRSLF